jgi:regulator of cell morphogenesis and NO signaling
MTESLAAALVREHREIDDGIQEFVRVGDTRALTRAIRALRRHIYLEEEFLFPPLRDAGLLAPIFVMLREHGQLWDTLDALDRALTSGGAADIVCDLCRQLMVLEQHHNPKEERIVYPQADHVLTAPATTRLRDFLAAGVLPDGWVCERARMASR